MVGDSARHAAVLDELVEWWQDLSRQDINSRAVLLPVAPRWGRTHCLKQFATVVNEDEASKVIVRVGLDEDKPLPDGLGAQALKLQELFSEAPIEHRAAEVLGVDRLGGAIQLGLGVAGLFVTPIGALVGLLLANVVASAVSQAYDTSPAGQEGAVAKLARQVAALSVSVPVVVIIDDADRLELDLAVVLIENLIERINGRVLVVAALNLDGKLLSALTSRARYGLTEGRVRTVDADSDMKYPARVDLVTQLCPDLPAPAAHRIGRRTQTFAEVFAVTSAERLTELDIDGDNAAITTAVDKVIDSKLFNPKPPSRQAVVLTWAGGVMHPRQADRAAAVLDEDPVGDNGDVRWSESLARVADPASLQLATEVGALADKKKHELARVVLDTAVEVGKDPKAGLIEKIVAWQAAHRVRADLQDRAQLLGVQCQLVHGLEDLGDLAAAYQVGHDALDDLDRHSQADDLDRQARDELATAVLRLAGTDEANHNDPLVSSTIAAATAGGAAVGLEARIWAAIDLLGQPDQRERALDLTDEITAELSQRDDLGAIANHWRLLLAFHAGRAGHPAISQQLLSPILSTADAPENSEVARILRKIAGPQVDTRLQIIGLEAELAELPPDADNDLLRIHHALAFDYTTLGNYDRALRHGQQELLLRSHIQGANHPDALDTRSNIAFWTGNSGHPAEALRLYQQLLPDQQRVLGPDHINTLTTRTSIAKWAEISGHPAEALKFFNELLPDLQRVLGPDDLLTLRTWCDIAFWFWHYGDPAVALQFYRQLLPSMQRVLGPDDPETLRLRNNIAACTGKSGHPAEALRLYEQLLPDLQRILGLDHPETLTTRNNIAACTEESGHPAEALPLYQQLLPDMQRIRGLDHPDTLTTRSNIAACTEKSGHPAKALRLFQELLSDQERVLGPDHPDTLRTLNNIQRLSTQGTSPDG